MKKLILGLVAASLVASPAAAAQSSFHSDHNRYEQNDRGRDVRSDRHKAQKSRAHAWRKGQRFDRRQVRTYRVIDNPRAYGLRTAPRGYRWVRADNDAVMIAVATGLISSVISGRF